MLERVMSVPEEISTRNFPANSFHPTTTMSGAQPLQSALPPTPSALGLVDLAEVIANGARLDSRAKNEVVSPENLGGITHTYETDIRPPELSSGDILSGTSQFQPTEAALYAAAFVSSYPANHMPAGEQTYLPPDAEQILELRDGIGKFQEHPEHGHLITDSSSTVTEQVDDLPRLEDNSGDDDGIKPTPEEQRLIEAAIAAAKSSGVPRKDMKFMCETCSRIFTRLYNLKSHIRSHQGLRPFNCKTCDASFTRNHDLNRHQRTHVNEKPYTCPNCNKNFSRKDALRRHQRQDATGKKNVCIPQLQSAISEQSSVPTASIPELIPEPEHIPQPDLNSQSELIEQPDIQPITSIARPHGDLESSSPLLVTSRSALPAYGTWTASPPSQPPLLIQPRDGF